MTSCIEAGTILVDNRAPLARDLLLQSEPYSENWNVVLKLNGYDLDRELRASGWNFFFIGAPERVLFRGAVGSPRLHQALKRILTRVQAQNFNCLEITDVVAKRFLGLRYAVISAHPRHIQKSCQLGNKAQRLIG